MILDLNGQKGTLPLGYNHPELVGLSDELKSTIAQRPTLAFHPPDYWPDKLLSTIMTISPSHLTQVFTTCCGLSANENALKAAFLYKRRKLHGEPVTEEELRTAMLNATPGSPNFNVVRVAGGYHGTLIGTLSCTSSCGGLKVDIPAKNWPLAPFPELKYPLEAYPSNIKAEEQALEETSKLLRDRKTPVATLVIEPISSHLYKFASKSYYQNLAALCKENDVVLFSDERLSCGGATGRFWAHESLDFKPDMVSFGGKLQISGVLCREELKPDRPYMILNTWSGDPMRIHMTSRYLKYTKSKNLLQQAEDNGEYLLNNLYKLQELGLISNTRGLGLLIAFETASKESAWKLTRGLLERGVYIGEPVGNTVKLSPSLIFGKKHSDLFLEALEGALKSL